MAFYEIIDWISHYTKYLTLKQPRRKGKKSLESLNHDIVCKNHTSCPKDL